MPELDGYGRHEILHMAWFLSRARRLRTVSPSSR